MLTEKGCDTNQKKITILLSKVRKYVYFSGVQSHSSSKPL